MANFDPSRYNINITIKALATTVNKKNKLILQQRRNIMTTTLKTEPSGIYTTTFYKLHYASEFLEEDFVFDLETINKHPSGRAPCVSLRSEEKLKNTISLCDFLFEPRDLEPTIALHCGLIPFKLDSVCGAGTELLAFETRNTLANLHQLEAYQYLVNGTMDPRGRLYSMFTNADQDSLMFTNADQDSLYFYDGLNIEAVNKIKEDIRAFQHSTCI